MRLVGLPPIADRETKILIVGTFPSSESLLAREYYANPKNQFWRVIGSVLHEKLLGMDYVERVRRLRDQGVGLWDVVASCERQGSLDKAILNPTFNEFSSLTQTASNIELVCYNGSRAATWAFNTSTVNSLVLPSTSSANTHSSIEAKANDWARSLLKYLV